MNRLDNLDTSFRTAIDRMSKMDRLQVYTSPIDRELEVAGVMKRLDDGKALLFPSVDSTDIPVIGNMLCCRENCEAAFGIDYQGIRGLIDRAFKNPIPPEMVTNAPVQECVHTDNIDVGEILPLLRHTEADSGRYITAGIVIVEDPETGVRNASYHRLQLSAGNRMGIQLDYGRHLRFAYERAKARNEPLTVAVCLGVDLALQYAAATMGSKMPEHTDEVSVAGGLVGRGLSFVKAVSQDIDVPADAEIILEGKILTDQMEPEGPFGEFIGYLAKQSDSPVFEVTAVTHRRKPIYQAINGYGRETVMLRKYVLESTLLSVLKETSPIVTDANMTAGGLHRFHAVVQVHKTTPAHNGLQRNIMMAAFGALKDLDMVTIVDEDIDINNPMDVEYAMATRFEASRDLILVPGARSHEYVRVSADGIRTKLAIDATVPFEQKAEFSRCAFVDVSTEEQDLSDASADYAHLWGSLKRD